MTCARHIKLILSYDYEKQIPVKICLESGKHRLYSSQFQNLAHLILPNN